MREVSEEERAEAAIRWAGNDNQRKPRIAYFDKVAKLDNAALEKETKQKIWLSAYANNNPRSDYHWHVDILYDECEKRDKGMYQRAFDAAKKSAGVD